MPYKKAFTSIFEVLDMAYDRCHMLRAGGVLETIRAV